MDHGVSSQEGASALRVASIAHHVRTHAAGGSRRENYGRAMNKCVIIAWGSLIWDPRDLSYSGTWRKGGPQLPIEYSRIAMDGRLTLVIDDDDGALCSTWTADAVLQLGDAIANLARRERCPIRHIGYTPRPSGTSGNDASFVQSATIERWRTDHNYDSVIWTALPRTFEQCSGRPFSVDAAIDYLDTLKGETRERAFEYIRRAPATTATPVRSAFLARWPDGK